MIQDRIRILLAGMPPMLHEIITDAIASEADLHILGTTGARESLLEAVHRTKADLIVTSDQRACEKYEDLLREHPRLKVIELATKNGHGLRYELLMNRLPLGALSASSLAEVIRASIRSTDRHVRFRSATPRRGH
jgi:DNA-binding NarL/FixJ family response regulator